MAQAPAFTRPCNPLSAPLDFFQERKATTYGFRKKNVFNPSGIIKAFYSIRVYRVLYSQILFSLV